MVKLSFLFIRTWNLIVALQQTEVCCPLHYICSSHKIFPLYPCNLHVVPSKDGINPLSLSFIIEEKLYWYFIVKNELI